MNQLSRKNPEFLLTLAKIVSITGMQFIDFVNKENIKH